MTESTDPAPTRGRGRPPIGDRITITLQPALIADIDREAQDRALSRAEVIRERLSATAWARSSLGLEH